MPGTVSMPRKEEEEEEEEKKKKKKKNTPRNIPASQGSDKRETE